MHYLALIIIPKEIQTRGDNAVYQYIHEIMKQFDEQREVKSYIMIPRDQFQAKYEEYKADHPNCGYATARQFMEDYHVGPFDYDGNLLSTRNPQGIYDWYSIGGRWGGELTGTRGDNLKNDMIPVKKLHDTLTTDNCTYGCVIDRQGRLQRDKNMHWRISLETVNITPEEWRQQYEKILTESADDYVVNLDCHC